MGEAVRQIKNESAKYMLQKELDLIKEGDLVCDVSQGRFEGGEAACACICWHAVVQILQEKPVKDETQMRKVISKGIETYNTLRSGRNVTSDTEGKLYFDAILAALNEKHLVQVVVPKGLDYVTGIDVIQAMPESIPIPGIIDENFPQVLNALDHLGQENDQKACGVMTCNGETVVVTYPEPGKPQLFDSHGRTYKGMSKGASVLTFKSTEALAAHLSRTLFAKATYRDFTCMFLIPSESGEKEVKKSEKKEKERFIDRIEEEGKDKEKEVEIGEEALEQYIPPPIEPAKIKKHAEDLCRLTGNVRETIQMLKNLFGDQVNQLPYLEVELRDKITLTKKEQPPFAQLPYIIKIIQSFIDMQVEPRRAIREITRNMHLSRGQTFAIINYFALLRGEKQITEAFFHLINDYERASGGDKTTFLKSINKNIIAGFHLTPSQAYAIETLAMAPQR